MQQLVAMASSNGRRQSVSFAATPEEVGEEQPLLQDIERVDTGGACSATGWNQPSNANPQINLPVYSTIHRIRADVIAAIDDPYSLEQLKDPRMNISVVRPLVDKFYNDRDISTIYCLLINRTQFLKEQSNAPHHQSVNITRALLCELVANRILRRYNEDNPGPQGLLLLARILVSSFDPFQNCPQEVLEDNQLSAHWGNRKEGGYLRKLPALEIAIISESKTLLSSSACQKVVNAIYEGRVVYTPSSFIDILPDHYKKRPIALYDPRKAPLLNQYRLIIPRTRNYLEIAQFMILLALYILVMSSRDPDNLTNIELVFQIYAFGWALDQFASVLEHGWGVYTQNLWSFLDVTFILIFLVYFFLRVHGLRTGEIEYGIQSMDVLAIGAPFLIPRLAFNLLSENMLFVSLRSMMADFAVLTLLAVWCFAGFLLSMAWLGNGVHEPITISKWMLWVWFGLDGTGIPRSVDFHWLLGPMLMVAFAFLGNTLFLTILVSMLSNTFANIVSNASAEIQYRRSVLTLEGVKSDAIFSYQPPFNILALCILLPLKFMISPRWFHKVNVFAIRVLNAPLLLMISYFERRALWSSPRRERGPLHRTKSATNLWDLSRGFSVHGDIQAVFDSAPPDENEDDEEISETDDEAVPEMEQSRELAPGKGALARPDLSRTQSKAGSIRSRTRRDSMMPFGGLKVQLKDMLDEDDAGENGKDAETRLQRMEKAMQRIEKLLEKIVADSEEERKEEVEEEGDVTPLEDKDPTLEAERHE